MPKTDSKPKTVGCETERRLTAEEEDALLTWTLTDWQEVERKVYKLQKRIYKASSCDDVRTVRRLQKLLIRYLRKKKKVLYFKGKYPIKLAYHKENVRIH